MDVMVIQNSIGLKLIMKMISKNLKDIFIHSFDGPFRASDIYIYIYIKRYILTPRISLKTFSKSEFSNFH